MANYRYTMGYKVGNTPIPDPTKFSGKDSDLDAEGSRDHTGYLHRNRVATKHPIKLEYENIGWDMIKTIMALLKDAKIQFTYPDPVDGPTQIDAYVGDRDYECVRAPGEPSGWIGTLKFSVIEY